MVHFVEVGLVLAVDLLQLHLHLAVGDLIIGLEETELCFVEVLLTASLKNVRALRSLRRVGTIAQFLRFLLLLNVGRLDWHCQHLKLVKGPLESRIMQSRRVVMLRSVNVVCDWADRGQLRLEDLPLCLDQR